MREGVYAIKLVKGPREQEFPVTDVQGKPCVCAEPGQEYHVKVCIYRNEKGEFPAKYLRLGMYVDGHDVQYWKRLDLSGADPLPTDPKEPVISRFWGFKKNVNDLRAFVFSVPEVINHHSHSITSEHSHSNLGSIRLVVHEATVSEGVYANTSGHYEAPGQQILNESKKFWQQPSVTTAAGARVDEQREKFLPLKKWANLSRTPIKEMVLFYHTPAMAGFLQSYELPFREKSAQSSLALSFDSSSSSSSTGKRRQRQQVIDLTSEEDEEVPIEDSTGSSTSSSSSSSSKKQRQNGNGDSTTSTNRSGSSDGGGIISSSSSSVDAMNTCISSSSSSSNGRADGEGEDVLVPIDNEISEVIRPKVQPPVLDLTTTTTTAGSSSTCTDSTPAVDDY